MLSSPPPLIELVIYTMTAVCFRTIYIFFQSLFLSVSTQFSLTEDLVLSSHLPVFRPLTKKVAWAKKFWSLNISSSYTTKRRKAKSGLLTWNWKVFRVQAGFRPLSTIVNKRHHQIYLEFIWKNGNIIL